MASVKLILRSDKADKNGDCPLYILVIKDRKKKYVSAGLKLKPSQWDEERQRVKKNFPNSARVNALLLKKVSDAQGTVADMERKLSSVSAKKIREAIKGKTPENFFNYAYDRCEKIKGTVSLRTYIAYTSNLKKFEGFLGHRDLNFDEMTPTLLNDYINFCSNKEKNANGTIRFALSILKVFYKEAIKEDFVNANHYPFNKVSVKKEPSKRSFLNKDQLEAFKNFEVSQESKAQVYKDMFLFAVSAGGLRFSDVLELRWEDVNLKENRITKKIRKTGRQHSFKFGQSALEILNKYKPKKVIEKNFVFPMLENDTPYFENDNYRLAETERCSSLCSFHLKRIGKDMKLPFPLSFHLSRHTFATNSLNNGMRIEHVSKLMDHSDIGITQIYAKIISQELDDAVDKYVF